MARPRKHADDAARKRAWKRANRRYVFDPAHEQPLIVPPAVKKAQQQRIDRLTRAYAAGSITPNQFILGEPARRQFSLSRTEILAILG